MKLRAPAVPLITVDPYFSVWSVDDRLNAGQTVHWTGKPNTMIGIAEIDGGAFRFMGISGGFPDRPVRTMHQQSVEITPLSTCYVFAGGGVELKAVFTTPLLPDDLELMSRPVTYLQLSAAPVDGEMHQVGIRLFVSEEICLNERGQYPVTIQQISLPDGIVCARMGSACQQVLNRSGDDLRIDWGYFYLAVSCNGPAAVAEDKADGLTGLCAEAQISTRPGFNEALMTFAYDDRYSIEYFGKKLKAYWKKDGQTIEEAIGRAFNEHRAVMNRCNSFTNRLIAQATDYGGIKYAELLSLAYRQTVAAHKLVLNERQELLFISKECFSNGCAATADVSYPSIPLFLLYNPELVRGMLRPIFDVAEKDTWPYPFAPHDAGCYPLLNGQVYGNGTDLASQMPIEECGNMLIMTAAVCIAGRDLSIARLHMPLLRQWADYLAQHGFDPENQLCTDDFAGHLPHNCNLSLKAIIALAAFSLLLDRDGDAGEASRYLNKAKDMASEWVKKANNGDGSFMLAFNQPGTFSLKYNLIWDKLFHTGLFEKTVIEAEMKSYVLSHLHTYGVPLDNRDTYTKSDWLMYCAAISDDSQVSNAIVDALWNFYNESPSRVPMTDWYDTVTARQIGFQNRTVQGGLFILLLRKAGICDCTKPSNLIPK